MEPLDEYDIRQAFDALDEDQEGYITVRDMYTIYLGLGYEPKRLSIHQIAEMAKVHDGVTFLSSRVLSVEQVLAVLNSLNRDRDKVLTECFQIIDHDKKGFLLAHDIEQLSQEAGDPISIQQANRIVSYLSSDGRITPKCFVRLFAPQES